MTYGERLRRARRDEREEAYWSQVEAKAAAEREAIEAHEAQYADLIARLHALDIDPEELRRFLADHPGEKP